MGERQGRLALLLSALVVLAVLPYLRSLALPFISDDYVQIKLARDYGPVSSWGDLARDPLYRCRATSLVLTYWTEGLFGLAPLAYNLSSLVLHVLNTLLVLGLGLWRPVGWRIAAVAAAFFAVYEGHQEAVIWYAALPELLVFFFSLLSFLFWVLWVQAPDSPLRYYIASLICFVLALYSKESAVAVAPLLLLPAACGGVPWRRWLGPWLPFVALAAVYTAMIFAGRAEHLHFHDGTFSLRAPVALVLANSTARLFWFWGAASLVALAVFRPRDKRLLLLLGAAWIVLTFLPYSFIAYMPRVPSRHTYFASAGLALVVSAAAWTLRQRARRQWIVWVLAGVMAGHNSIYVWTKKQRQFAERAEPTEALVRFAEKTPEPIYVHCFPYAIEAGQWAVAMRLGKKVEPLGATPVARSQVFCLSPGLHRF